MYNRAVAARQRPDFLAPLKAPEIFGCYGLAPGTGAP